jgi:hypothetical protein
MPSLLSSWLFVVIIWVEDGNGYGICKQVGVILWGRVTNYDPGGGSIMIRVGD